MKNNRVLITHGASLVGCHIAELLVNEETAEIIILDNSSQFELTNLDRVKEQGNVTLVEGNISDRRLLLELMQGVDLVFHQATIPLTQSTEELLLALESLSDGCFNLLEASVQAGVKKVIAASSTSAYSMVDQLTKVQCHHHPKYSLYGAARVCSENLLHSFFELYGLNYVALHYFNVYGPGMSMEGFSTEVVIPWLEAIASSKPPVIYGKGTEIIDLIYVEDIARANILAAKSGFTDEIFDIGSGMTTNLTDLAYLLIEVTGCNLQPAYRLEQTINPLHNLFVDISKARDLIGFEARISLQEGLEKVVNWWQKEKPETNYSQSTAA